MQNSGNYFNNKQSIKSLLSQLGYNVEDRGEYLKCNAAHREGRDISSMTIYPNSSLAIDHVLGEKYTLKYFFSKVLNVKEELVGTELKNRNFDINLEIHEEPKIKAPKIFDECILNDLVPVYDYFLERGVDKSILEETKCGLYTGEIKYLKNRIVFPCFNSQKQINLIAARDITKNNEIYWIIKGQKTNCVYPAFMNAKDIRDKNSVFLVEGISDMLALMSCGIRNIIVLFGTEINLAILNYLLKINIEKIYISTNNDLLRTGDISKAARIAGTNAAGKIENKLRKYFNYNQVYKVFPKLEKDWGMVLEKYGKEKVIEELKEYI